ncbi:protoporphyrinogen/coproporphyrinogen oxidase [Candidatus Poriferisodalis sp.]|uniref:protoporphyrinogen/coproporphyrinogen oxidase n=1 Tax=Candidatus Poriferisodalis sp. TaxID=3101277 RepID=UPI003B02C477
MADVVVIGAGPAGLSAALDLVESGHSCTLVEAGAAVGGMAGSFEFAGQRVDYGSHRLHDAISERQRARFERLLGDDLQVRPRNGRIRLRDRWIGFPLRTWDLLTHVPPSFGLRVAADMVTGPLRRTPGPSFDAEVRARLGPTVADEFYGPYARKLYGVEPAELDAELARRRVSATSGVDVLRRVVRAARPKGRQFLYPRHGYGQLSEAMADAAVDAGVNMRLSTAAAGIELDAKGVAVHLQPQGQQTGDALHVDAVLSTVPIPTLASILTPAPPPEIADALERCRTRSMVLAYLVVDRDQYTPYDAHYFPGPDTVVARLSEPKNYRDGDDPAGQSVLCAEIPCWSHDEIWHADDVEIAEQVTADLEASGLPAPSSAETTVRRLPSVYPVFERATMTDRAAVAEWLASLAPSGLISFGRQGLAVIDNLHHVTDMGADAASALTPEGEISSDAWLASLGRFASHVVED